MIHGHGRVLVTAHRGASAEAPENTLAAVRRAMADGADLVETDVQETADGALVLLHDHSLARTAGLRRALADLTLAQVRRLDAGSWFGPEYAGEPVPTLEELLALARGRIGLNLELKTHGREQRLAERTVDILRAAGAVEACAVTASEPGLLHRVRTLAPEIPLGLIVARGSPPADVPGLALLSLNARLATAEQVRANRAAGLATHVWTVDEPAEMARLAALGVDSIITNRPDLLRRVLADLAPS